MLGQFLLLVPFKAGRKSNHYSLGLCSVLRYTVYLVFGFPPSLFSHIKHFSDHAADTSRKKKKTPSPLRYHHLSFLLCAAFLISTLKNTVTMATLKTNSHKMAEFTISFFSCLHHSFIHSFKNYSSNVHYVSSAFLGIKRITKEAHYVI